MVSQWVANGCIGKGIGLGLGSGAAGEACLAVASFLLSMKVKGGRGKDRNEKEPGETVPFGGNAGRKSVRSRSFFSGPFLPEKRSLNSAE